MIRERESDGRPGIPILLIALVVLVATVVAVPMTIIRAVRADESGVVIASLVVLAVVLVLELVAILGCYMVDPNEARVLQLFGEYVGTTRMAGLRWNNPFYTKRRVSVRTRNFETGKLKVNEKTGNPIEIGAVVVWRVVDTAEAMFNVDDYVNFVQVQSEAAVRNLATDYPYIADADGEMALASHTNEISQQLRDHIQARLEQAGVQVIEARISHLAYASEIAAAMLVRQQASAVVAARAKIVEGAVGMVEHALDMLSEREVVELDDERRAAMVSNLLVVLCGDRHAQPVVNAGSLYH